MKEKERRVGENAYKALRDLNLYRPGMTTLECLTHIEKVIQNNPEGTLGDHYEIGSNYLLFAAAHVSNISMMEHQQNINDEEIKVLQSQIDMNNREKRSEKVFLMILWPAIVILLDILFIYMFSK